MTSRVKARIKPELLVWTRESAGFSLAEAATKLDINEARLSSWEIGIDAPTIPQLRKLAALYKRPLAVFYLQQVPTGFQVIRDLRRLPGSGFRTVPPDLLLEVRRARERRALALELMEDMGEIPPTFSLQAMPEEDPESVGHRIRDALGVNQDEQGRWRDQDGRHAYREWRERIEAAGVLVFQATRIDSEVASGFAISEDPLPVIVVNRKDAPTRRTFGLLHELAHLMLRVSGVSESDLDVDASRPPEDQAIEVFCNQVAAAALIPREWLLSDTRVAARNNRAIDWTDAEMSDLARMFGVSRYAVLRRLLTFGRTTETFYRRKHHQWLDELNAQRKRQKEQTQGGMPRDMPQEVLSNYGRPLVRMILGNYYQDRLTLSEAVGYLGIKTKHMAKLEQKSGLKS